MTAAAVPSHFQHEIIELHTDDTLKDMYLNTPLVDLCQRYVNADNFRILWKHGLIYVSLFGSTDWCEQFFSKLNLTKSSLRFSLTDQNVKMELRVATFSTSADIACLTREKNFQAFNQKFFYSFNIYCTEKIIMDFLFF